MHFLVTIAMAEHPDEVSILFTVRRYASAVLAVVVCPSVRLSQAGIVSKRLQTGSHKQCHTIAQGL